MTVKWKLVWILTLIFLYACATYFRNTVWHEVPVLWTDVVTKSPRKGRGYLNLCQYHSNRNDLEKALFYCDTAIIRFDSEANNYLLADAYINRGAIYSDLQRYDLALADYSKALSIRPDNFKIYNNIGNVYAWQGQYNSALEAYSRSITLNPGYAMAYVNRGYLRRFLNDPGSAVQDFSVSINLNPDNDKAYAGRAAAFLSLGQTDRATGDLNICCSMGNGKCCELIKQLWKR